MFKFSKLNHKLIVAFLVLALIPLVLFATYSVKTASDALHTLAFNQLESVRAIKKSQVEDYVASMQAAFRVTLSSPNMRQALMEFVKAYNDGGGKIKTEDWEILAEFYGSQINNIVTGNEWYDLFLINPNGVIVYTDAKQSDLGMSITNSSLNNSSFANAFQQAADLSGAEIIVSDFAPYAPSNNKPAAFMVAKVHDEEEYGGGLVGYLAFQIHLDKINHIMQQREGMGATGESYLVGADRRMRSDSFLDPTGHSVLASFVGTVDKNGVDSHASNAALRGETGSEIVMDYNGNPVLSAYSPFKFGNNNWALLVEIDEAEAFAPAQKLRSTAILLVSASALVILVVGFLVARNISRAVIKVSQSAEAIANGDLTINIDLTQSDEVGTLQKAMQSMVTKLHDMVEHISSSADQQAAAAEELSVITEQTNKNMVEQHRATDMVATAITEMSATVDEVSSNTTEASLAAEEAAMRVMDSSKAVDQTVAGIQQLAVELDSTMGLIRNKSYHSLPVTILLICEP
ncbi:MAG TPA: methyl-accepting chemotaxis protein [Porticoccus sp.]|nr:methyl-accepting chemotaxis protein [Porticoccus sp.]